MIMKYYSTNRQAPEVSLSEAVIKGLAPDKGLYMPERIKPLPQEFFDHIQDMSQQEIAFEVASCFFGEDIPADDLKHIVYDTLQFDIHWSRSTTRSTALSSTTVLPAPSRMWAHASWPACSATS